MEDIAQGENCPMQAPLQGCSQGLLLKALVPYLGLQGNHRQAESLALLPPVCVCLLPFGSNPKLTTVVVITRSLSDLCYPLLGLKAQRPAKDLNLQQLWYPGRPDPHLR